MCTFTINFEIADSLREIPIEQRSPKEVSHILGLNAYGQAEKVAILPKHSAVRNDAFDVAPGQYVTALGYL